MLKKAKLVSAVYAGTTWQAGSDTLYNQNVVFDNGDSGQASSKEQQAKWVVGKEYNYDIETGGQYGNKIKGIKAADAPAFGGGKGGSGFKPKTFSEQAIIISQSSVAAAANWSAQRSNIGSAELLQLATKIYEWNLANYEKAKVKDVVAAPPVQQQAQAQQPLPPAPTQAPPVGASDNLPW